MGAVCNGLCLGKPNNNAEDLRDAKDSSMLTNGTYNIKGKTISSNNKNPDGSDMNLSAYM